MSNEQRRVSFAQSRSNAGLGMAFLFAGTFEQAREYARENNLRPTEWAYLDRSEKLKGLRKARIVTCGSWWERKDSHEIEDEIKISVMFNGCVLESDTLTIPNVYWAP